VTGNRNVVGLVGQDQPRLFIRHENFETVRVGGIAAHDAVLARDKYFAELRDGLCIRLRR
jgi:hypothetical protein